MSVLKVDELGFFNKTLICMMGLPYSGKSTEAARLGAPVVNPDSIRVAIHGQKFYGPAEPLVWATAKIMVRSLFMAGHDVVILDATNTTAKRRAEWLGADWRTKWIHVETDVETCCERAIAAGDDEMVDIIRGMHNRFEPLNEYEQSFAVSR